MEGQAVKSTHPLLVIAAVSVTVFSLVGIGAMLGWIPTSTGTPSPVSQAPEVQPAPEPGKPVASPAKPKHVAKANKPARIAEAAVPPPPPVVAICADCGVIDSISEIKKEGQGSGAGAVGGAVVGGVVGHQVGSGRGRDVATVLGAIGGGLLGNTIEKKAKTSSEYRIVVRFEDGSTRTYPSATVPTWRIGERVKVINGVIQANG
jgi:outer membrane lipoprotein SlyB